MPVDVGVYVRISDDTEGEAKGVGRQQDDCCALAAVRRWNVVKIYEDNDYSAYQRKVTRPSFEQMLGDLHLGVIQGVVVYNLDRFARQPRDLERAIDIFEQRADFVFATLEGDVNLSSIDGRTMARVMVAFANKSSHDTGRRVQRKQLELAGEGKPHGGRQPYGWGPDGLKADPAARKEILAAHKAILEGARIADIHRDWLQRGVAPTSRTGRRFQGAEKLHHKTVTRVLTNPALAGMKVYRGETVTDEQGAPIKAAWEPICTAEHLSQVTEALAQRKPTRERAGTNATRYLLSGIARCGLCGSPMRGQMRRRADRSQYPVYLCDKSGYSGGCGKIARKADPVDRLVIELALADQKRAAVKTHKGSWSTAQQERLDELTNDIRELREAKIAGKISIRILLDLMPDLEREQNALAVAKRRAERENRVTQVVEHTREAFDALPLERQRALVLRSLRSVVIRPQGKGVVKFDPDLIEPVWAL